MSEFSHIDGEGVRMVDVGGKEEVRREAAASGRIILGEGTLRLIEAGGVEKGNVFATTRVAAVQAVKETWDDIPLCHPIPISGVDVHLSIEDDYVRVEVTVRSVGRTGVEMEALNGVARGLLTVWDMVKSVEKDAEGQYPETVITDVRVERKVKRDVTER
ncbi:MAG: putative cyclic pyranopterin monophosphate synthase [Methanonatronarchaeales archaeon]|nr:putative cyclic pyranopterin monophosphate synthase [Methanonatronarchaeales archaeon]